MGFLKKLQQRKILSDKDKNKRISCIMPAWCDELKIQRRVRGI